MANTKVIPKRVYGLLLESNKTFFLSVQAAFSLEEAFYYAKLEFERMHPSKQGGNSLDGAKISLFSSKTFEELDKTKDLVEQRSVSASIIEERDTFKKAIGEEIGDLFDMFGRVPEAPRKGLNKPPKEALFPTPEESKNNLMNLIIKFKDTALFEQNKGTFTEAEIKYIQERLK